MPPKSSSGKEKDLTDEDEVLQAVILADSFNKRFKPLTVGKPRCLLPVCNATLLDWTFESLALAGVQEIFVVCRSYAELVKAAIRDSKWSNPSLGLKIVPIITSKETFTPGDAMRDIYTRGIITSDFVLVMGDLVSSIRIDEVVRVHRERRRKNKDAIMTMVVKPSGSVHRTRSKGESGIFVLDPETSECLHYEHVTGYPPKKFANIPREILAEHPEVEIRNDLIDCGIDVCSVEVPSLFQDNFDYGDIRRDFVHGVLTSDLLMKNIHCYIAREGYAARVADTRSYDAVSKDILSRWTFPLVPDDNHPGGHFYEHQRGNKYIAKGNSVVLSRTCEVGPNTLIGAGTKIADNANVQASVIGQRCTIGPGVTLRNAYIFDDTHIEAGSSIEFSIVGSGVRVGENSIIARGCLVADGVVLGKNARLGEFERVSRKREEGEEDEEEEETDDEDSEWEEEAQPQCIPAIVGDGSNAVVWPKGPRPNDEELDEVERFNNQRLMRIGDDAADLPMEEETTDDSDESDTETESSYNPLSRVSSATSTSAMDSVSPSAIHALQAAAAESEFKNEVTQSLDRAFAEGHTVDDAAVELKTLRMASNVPLRRVREAVVAAIVERIEIVDGDAAAQRKVIAQMIARWGPLIDKIGGVDPVETIDILQYHCAKSARLPLFGQILAALYQADLVEEDDIRAWHAKPEAQGKDLKDGAFAENVKRCWSVGTMMIQQFDDQESSEEESGEEESEEEAEVKKPAAIAAAKKTDEDSEEDEEEDDDEEESDEEDAKTITGKTASTPAAANKAPSTTDDSEEDDESEEESDEEEEQGPATTKTPEAPASKAVPVPSASKPSESSESEEESEEDEEESEEDETPAPPPVQKSSVPAPASVPPPATQAPPTTAPASASKTADSESEEESEEDEDEESEEDAPAPPPSSSSKPSASSQAPPPVAPASTARAASTQESSEEESSEEEDEEEEEEETPAVAQKPTSTPQPQPQPQTAQTAPPAPASPSSAASSTQDSEEEEDSDESEEDTEEEDAVPAASQAQAQQKSVAAPSSTQTSSTSAPAPAAPASATKQPDSATTESEDSEDDEETTEEESDEDTTPDASKPSTIQPSTSEKFTTPPSTVPSSSAGSIRTATSTTKQTEQSGTEESTEEEEEDSEDEDEEVEGTPHAAQTPAAASTRTVSASSASSVPPASVPVSASGASAAMPIPSGALPTSSTAPVTARIPTTSSSSHPSAPS
ncbi:hypothetical protein K474DRAFT_1654876 [Panus rudis PR-1116 ss-1]|nr:hypothetical protein K474DRAFT_1654876 [Panus rudis PR-1116 ss-1]